MEKIKLLGMYLMAVVFSFSMAACGLENIMGESEDDDDDYDYTTKTPEQVAAESKTTLEACARELMNEINADDFKDIADIASVVENSDNDYNQVNQWCTACIKACRLEGYTDEKVQLLYKAANFKGHFVLEDGEWTYLDEYANDLQFILTNSYGQECVLTVETSGSTTNVHHSAFDTTVENDDEEDSSLSYAKSRGITTLVENTFAIPETINITLKQGDTPLADVTINTKVNIQSGDFDYTRDNAEVSVDAKINSYELNVSRAIFRAGKSAEATVQLTKNDNSLIECNASATGQLYTDKDPVGKTGKVEASILGGKVRIDGKISNISDFISYLDKADESENDMSAVNSYLEKANNLFYANLYLDYNDNSSAQLKFYSVHESDYNYEYYGYEPFLVFGDDTKYSFSSYFDESTYDNVISQFTRLVEDFVGMFKQE